MWSPLAEAWPPGLVLPPENSTGSPEPGQVLLYAGAVSEPELLLVYGTCRFASKVGPLAGNPVLVIEDRRDRLARLGRQILWHGALDLRIEHVAPSQHRSERTAALKDTKNGREG